MGDPIQDPLNISLPEDLQLDSRAVLVAPYKLSTFRLMHDPFDPNRDRWFEQNNMPRVSDGNEAKCLIRGEETYEDMAGSMREAATSDPQRPWNSPGFIYLAGWDLQQGGYDNMQMLAGDASSTPQKIFEAAAAAQTEVRVMAWANGTKTPFDPPFTAAAIDEVNRLSTGRGIVDWKTGVWWDPPVTQRRFHNGSHHQKVMMTHGSYALISYLGGIDLDPGRLDGKTPGWQDVHCRVRGPAADDVLLAFRQRWDDYINGNDPDANHDTHQPAFTDPLDKSKRNGLAAGRMAPSRPVDGEPYRQSVQVCRTFHSQLYDRIAPGHLAGEKTIRQMVKHAINQAEQFIYIEDQYLFSMEISNELKNAIAKGSFRYLIILISDDNHYNAEVADQKPYRRAQFLKNLLNAPGGEKVKVFVRRDRYVHSKIYIVDDKFAVIGSANCNRRGMQHDSEISAGIYDKSSDKEQALHFARRMRMRLWATHLNISAQSSDPNRPANSQAEFAELADGVGSAIHWIKRAQNVRVAEYVVNEDLNMAIKGLERTKNEIKASVTQHAPAGFQGQINAALDLIFLKFTLDKRGVDNAWDDLIDPGDP